MLEKEDLKEMSMREMEDIVCEIEEERDRRYSEAREKQRRKELEE